MARRIGLRLVSVIWLAAQRSWVAEGGVYDDDSCQADQAGEGCRAKSGQQASFDAGAQAREAESSAALRDYVLTDGDCPGNDLCEERIGLDACARKCNAHPGCMGFSFLPVGPPYCMMKYNTCFGKPPTRESPHRFYHRTFHPLPGPPREVLPNVPKCARDVFDAHKPPPALIQALPEIGGAFIVHWPPLKERRANLEVGLQTSGLHPATWVTWLNKEDIPSLPKGCLYDHEYDMWATQGTKSVNVKHLWIFYWTWKMGLENVLVLEDDVELTRSYVEELRQLTRSLPEGYTSISLSGFGDIKGIHHHERVLKSGHLHGPGLPTRTACGYIISSHGARLMLQYVFADKEWPCRRGGRSIGLNDAFDHMMDHVLLEGSYWYEPMLWKVSNKFEQQSHYKDGKK